MKMRHKTWAVAALSVAALQPLAFAQSTVRVQAQGCKESHRIIAPRNPLMTADGNIVPGQAIVQARLALDQNTTVRVIEHPRTVGRDDLWNSIILIQRGQEQKRYPLKQVVKYGEGLRITEVVSICTSSDEGMLVLAFESASTGTTEGFSIIRYSSASINVKGFPPVTQGKIVIQHLNPDKAELWSAASSPEGSIECDACEKFYQIQDCNFGESDVECTPRAGTVGPLMPERFMRHRIEIR